MARNSATRKMAWTTSTGGTSLSPVLLRCDKPAAHVAGVAAATDRLTPPPLVRPTNDAAVPNTPPETDAIDGAIDLCRICQHPFALE